MATGVWPWHRQYRTAVRVAAFIPPAGAPVLFSEPGQIEHSREEEDGALDDTDAHALLLGHAVRVVEARRRAERVQAVLELGVAHAARERKVLGGDRTCDCLGLQSD